MAGITGDIAQL